MYNIKKISFWFSENCSADMISRFLMVWGLSPFLQIA
jgi:hypothetical protein